MKPGIDQPDRSFHRFASPAALFGTSKATLVLAAFTLAGVCASLSAQQYYGNQYAAPAPQYSTYPQPQYEPQYGQPQYTQPQYSQPQYQQPQYAQPQYSQPQYEQPAYPQQPDNAQPQQPYAGQGQYGAQPPDLAQPQGQAMQPLSAGDLEQLLAPIALYPDNLLAQILAASTYPAQVAAADDWLHGMQAQGYGSPDQIAAGADAQTAWDPSVKALAAFPQVLDMLNQNLQWTTALGNAYYNQPEDVMQTIQVLRQRAQQAGNLQDTPQEDVTDDQGYLDVEPAEPDMVYVPAYDPWYAYGAPLAPYPGFYCAAAINPFWGVRFGFGIGMGAFRRMAWGWGGWGMGWHSHSLLYNRANYSTRSTSVRDWGFARGGQRVFGNRGLSIAGRNGMPGAGYRTPQPYGRYGNSYQAAPRGSYAQPGERSGGSSWRGNSYTHPAMPGQQAYGRVPQQYARPQYDPGRSQAFAGGERYSRPAYGYGYNNGSAQHYAGQPGMAYSHPYPVNRAPSYNSPGFGSSRAFSGRSNPMYGGGFARNDRSSGFRSFGNGRAPSSFGGGHASSGFSHHGGGGSFGGGHASGGFSHGGGSGGGHSGGGHGRGR